MGPESISKACTSALLLNPGLHEARRWGSQFRNKGLGKAKCRPCWFAAKRSFACSLARALGWLLDFAT